MLSRRDAFLVPLAAAPLAACAAISAGTPQLVAEKALYIAELAYNGFASSVIAARPTGAVLAALKDIDARAYVALTAARAGTAAAQSVLDALAGASAFLPVATAPTI